MTDPKKPDLSQFSSKIKDIYIELPDYPIFHSPSGKEDGQRDNRLIGRKEIKTRIVETLLHAKSRSGAYMITGFRGMGKTSLVREVIRQVKNQDHSVVPVELSLAQDELRDIDVIRHLAIKICHRYSEYFHESWTGLVWKLRYLFLTLIIGGIPIGFWLHRLLFSFLDSFQVQNWTVFAIVFFEVLLYACFVLTLTFTAPFLLKRTKWKSRWAEAKKKDPQERVRRSKWMLVHMIISVLSTLLIVLWSSISALFSTFSNNCLDCFNPGDYLLFIVVLPTLSLIGLCAVALRFGIAAFESVKLNTPVSILNRLTNLKDSIEAQVTLEKGATTEMSRFGIKSGWTGKKGKVYPMAQAKSVEYELIDILESISSLKDSLVEKWFFRNPKFIIVFDELDKIEPHYANGLNRKSEAHSNLENGSSIFGTEGQRLRQEALARLLANLKHFLNVAQAKFFFIAGREMFDASLADISDRESFFGSVFHDVFYVESFYKEKPYGTNTWGITSMIEDYVCRAVLAIYEEPSDSNKNPKSSEGYPEILKYLQREIKKSNRPLTLMDVNRALAARYKYDWADNTFHGWTADWKRMEREKVISTLQNFIVYLAYRSNGTPKSLSALFEDHLELFPRSGFDAEKKQIEDSRVWVTWPNNQKDKKEPRVFLALTYHKQYILGLTSYLIRPYLITHSHFQRTYGDKLLVSTTYLLDHLFKFHQHGFSLRNLELTPEIITFNKAPELRHFIEDLIDFLTQSQLRETTYGLFQFKFFKKITNEIAHVSRISEHESAAFNFTLDESLLIKRHYHKKLQELQKSYPPDSVTVPREHINSIAFVHSILGDLHFFDREYDDAILHYTNTIQSLRRQDMAAIQHFSFFLYLREKLKLVLTLEKMNDFQTALVHVTDLTDDVLHFFISHQPPYSFGGKHNDLWNSSEHAADDARKEKDRNFLKNMRFIIVPFIEELMLIEKLSPTGITHDDLQRNQSKFEKLLGHVLDDSVFKIRYLKALYRHHVATILYYKNGSVNTSDFEPEQACQGLYGLDVKAFYNGRKQKNSADQEAQVEKIKVHQDFRSPVSAYLFYCESFELQLARQPRINEALKGFIRINLGQDAPGSNLRKTIEKLIDLLGVGSAAIKMETIAKAEWEQFGSSMSKIGDCHLSMVRPNDANSGLSPEMLHTIFGLLRERDTGDDFSGFDIRTLQGYFDSLSKDSKDMFWHSTDAVVFSYFIAAMCYRKAGRYTSYAQQLIKIQYLYRDYLVVQDKLFSLLPYEEKQEKKGSYSKLQKQLLRPVLNYRQNSILSKILETVHWTQQTTGRPQVLKGESIMKYEPFETKEEHLRTLYNSTSMNPDMKEATIIYSELLLRAQKGKKKYLGRDFNTFQNPVNAYATVSNKFIRLLELNFKAHLNFEYMKDSGIKSWLDYVNLWRKLSSILKFQLSFEAQEPDEPYGVITLIETTHELSKLYSKWIKKVLIDENSEKDYDFGRVHKLLEKSTNNIEIAFRARKPHCITILLNRTPNQLKEFCFDMIELVNYGIGPLTKGDARRTIYDLFTKQDFIEWVDQLKQQSQDRRAGESRNPSKQKFEWNKEDIDEVVNAALNVRSVTKEENLIRESKVLRFACYLLQVSIEGIRSNLLTETISGLNLSRDKDFQVYAEELQKTANWPQKPTFIELGKFLISDSLFCMSEILRILSIYGVTYMYNHSFNGYMHMNMADWIRYHHLFIKVFESQLASDDHEYDKNDPLQIEKLIGRHTLNKMDPKYHQERAITHFQQAIEMHGKGKAYRRQLNHHYYLEEDYNDNFYHFCAALERYKINAGLIRHNIEKLKEDVRHSRFYQYSSYVNTATTPESA